MTSRRDATTCRRGSMTLRREVTTPRRGSMTSRRVEVIRGRDPIIPGRVEATLRRQVYESRRGSTESRRVEVISRRREHPSHRGEATSRLGAIVPHRVEASQQQLGCRSSRELRVQRIEDVAGVNRAGDDLALRPAARASVDPLARLSSRPSAPQFFEAGIEQAPHHLCIELTDGNPPIRQQPEVAAQGDAARLGRGIRLIA